MGTWGYPQRRLVEVVERRRSELSRDGWSVIAERRTAFGQHCWWLLERTDGTRLIVLDLIRREGEHHWVKTISEDQGPVYYDCPLDLLVDPQPTNEYARAWRAAVRDRADRPRRAAGLQVGDTVRIRGGEYRIDRLPGSGERSYLVSDADGRRYRASATEFEI